MVRARSLATEHAALLDELATSFDPKTARRVGELGPVANAVAEWNNANKVWRLLVPSQSGVQLILHSRYQSLSLCYRTQMLKRN